MLKTCTLDGRLTAWEVFYPRGSPERKLQVPARMYLLGLGGYTGQLGARTEHGRLDCSEKVSSSRHGFEDSISKLDNDLSILPINFNLKPKYRHSGRVAAAAWADETPELATVSEFGVVHLWSGKYAKQPKLRLETSMGSLAAEQCIMSPRGGVIAVASVTPDIHLQYGHLGYNRLRRRCKLRHGADGVSALSWLHSDSPGSKQHLSLLSGARDGSVFQFDWTQRQSSPVQTYHIGESVNCLAHTPMAGKVFSAGASDCFVHLFDSNSGERIARFNGYNDYNSTSVACLSFDHNGRSLMAGFNDGNIHVFDLRLLPGGSRRIQDFLLNTITGGSPTPVMNCAFVSNGDGRGDRYIAAAYEDNVVRVYKTLHKPQTQKLKYDYPCVLWKAEAELKKVAFRADGYMCVCYREEKQQFGVIKLQKKEYNK